MPRIFKSILFIASDVWYNTKPLLICVTRNQGIRITSEVLHLRYSTPTIAPTSLVDSLAYHNPLRGSVLSVLIWRVGLSAAEVIHFLPAPVSRKVNAGAERIYSLDRIFFSFWWLEREASELSGLRFETKLDDRNLLLEYTNNFAPLLKPFPVYGAFEFFYSTFVGTVAVRRPTLQQV